MKFECLLKIPVRLPCWRLPRKISWLRLLPIDFPTIMATHQLLLAPYIWSSGISKDILSINNNEDIAVPISQLTYMDDSTLVSSSLDGLENLLSIARDFYFLNNITANFQKYELVSSKLGNTLVTFNLTSEISNHLPPMSFSLQALKLSTSFRFFGSLVQFTRLS
ncbi:unnamed protein product [Rhizophagus irregularis]|nr:unnamed protein product [Rhizophagus irregularis]